MWGDVGVSGHKKEVRLLTLPPMVVNYHAVYFVLRMNTLCGESLLPLNGVIPFVSKYQFDVLVYNMSSQSIELSLATLLKHL